MGKTFGPSRTQRVHARCRSAKPGKTETPLPISKDGKGGYWTEIEKGRVPECKPGS